MNLSFADGLFDAYVSNDVFEHIADYRKAFSEAYRILKEKGKFIFSVPIFVDREKTETVTEILPDGKMRYIKPAHYHGNPLSAKGSLVFHEYAWDIIDFLVQVGFKDAYFICYASVEKGYFGKLPVIIEAVK